MDPWRYIHREKGRESKINEWPMPIEDGKK